MKRRTLLGVAFAAMLATTAITSTTASAEKAPNILPLHAAGAPLEFLTTSKKTEFGHGIFGITSTKDKGLGTSTAEKLGTFDIVLEGFTDQLARTCTGLSDKAGSGNVTLTGTYHVAAANEGTKLIVAVAFLLNEVHFACGTELIKVKGCVAGKLKEPYNTLSKTLTVIFETNEPGGKDMKITTTLNDTNNGTIACELKTAIGDTGNQLTNETGTETLETFKKAGAGVEVLVMPL